jgi:hypothetical protein
METSLHRQLKYHFASTPECVEVTVDQFRIDAIDADGCLVEIQHSALGAIRKKISSLLECGHRVRVVKPWIGSKIIETYECQGGPLVRRRKSPKKLAPVDIFRELIHFTQVFPNPNLTLEILIVDCVEQRVDRPNRRWKRRQFQVLDQHLLALHTVESLQTIADLWTLLGNPQLAKQFDTRELAESLQLPRWFAQQIAYTLHHCGGIRPVGKRGNSIVYQRVPSPRTKRTKKAA